MPELDAALLDFVVGIDDVHVVALLVRQHRPARNAECHHRLDAFDQNGDETAIDQRTVHGLAGFGGTARRVGDARAQQDGVGVGRHGRVDIVDLAGLVVDRAVRQAQLHRHRAHAALVGVALFQVFAGARGNGKQHIHRVLADDIHQRAGGRRDHVADRDRGPADLAGDGGPDLGISQVDLGDAQLRLRRHHLRRLGPLVGDRVIDVRSLARRRVQQGLRPLKLDIGVRQTRAGVGDRGFLLGNRGLERRAFQAVEQVALLDFGALGEQALFQEGGDAGGDRHPLDCLDAADEFRGFGDRLGLDTDDADRWRAGRGLGAGG